MAVIKPTSGNESERAVSFAGEHIKWLDIDYSNLRRLTFVEKCFKIHNPSKSFNVNGFSTKNSRNSSRITSLFNADLTIFLIAYKS